MGSDMPRTATLTLLLAGTCAAALSAAAPARAQDSSTTLGEVVVTTQRRAERLQDVPISVVSQTGAQLEKSGVTSIKDITFLVPGVKIDQTSNYVQPAIRGVSSAVTGPSTDSPVAVYLDGIIQPNQAANFFEFADIDRIEVAKGPQGTLFGRNATGGAISIFTKTPSFTPTGSLTLGYGNFNRATAKGYVSGPLVGDVLAASVSAYYESHKGYDYDVARRVRSPDFESKAVRAKLLFKPTDWASITFTGAYQDRFDGDPGTGVAFNGNTVAKLDPTAIITTRPHTISFDTVSWAHVKRSEATIRGEFQVSDLGTLTTLAGWSKTWIQIHYDADRAFTGPTGIHVAYHPNQPEIQYSGEVSFASRKFGPLSFVAGAYYYYNDNKFAAIRIQSSKNPATDFYFDSTNPQLAYAGFAEGNYDITDRLTAIAGIRYSWERRANKGRLGFGTSPNDPQPYILGRVTRFDAWTPRFSLRYRITDDTNVYGTFSKGFKSGGVQSGSFFNPVGAVYRPEKITAYEVGVKSQPMPSLTVNAAGYYYDYKDLQVQVQAGTGAAITLNAATARIYGFDLDSQWRATPELSFSLGLSLLDAKYKSFPNAVVLRPKPLLPVIGYNGNIATNAANGFPNGVDVSGNTLPRAPKATLTLVGDYTKDFGSGTWNLNVTAFYTTRVYFDSDERINQPAYAVINAATSWKPAGTNLKFEAWVRNLTDKTYISSTFLQDSADIVGYGWKRTFGGTVNYSF
jgi:iron complex outermembrane receptor protein